jgi:hypothetical protein
MMRKLIVMLALGGAILAMAPAAEAQWRHGGYRSHGPTVVGPRVYLGFGGYPYYGRYYGGGYYGGGYYGGYYGYPYGGYAYAPPVVYSAPPPTVYAAPAPAPAAPDYQREVVYPHGRYVLEGDGVSMAYHWTWIPSAAPPPPPPLEPRN